MTVKIVGEASEALRHATCMNCAAKLEFTDADTKIETHRDIDQTVERYRVLFCPRCENKIHVGERRSDRM